MYEFEFDQRVFDEDEGDFELPLEQAYALRPPRQAWRFDCTAAPNARPVFAREPHAMRVLIAMRDEEGWRLITRDGEVRPLAAVEAWAPLAAAQS